MARKESKIEDFAEELGTLLGNAQAKAGVAWSANPDSTLLRGHP
jgi:hypothetical protein